MLLECDVAQKLKNSDKHKKVNYIRKLSIIQASSKQIEASVNGHLKEIEICTHFTD